MLENITDKIQNLEPFYIKDFSKKLFSWQDLEGILNLRPFIVPSRFNLVNCNENFTFPIRSWQSDKNSIPPDIIYK